MDFHSIGINDTAQKLKTDIKNGLKKSEALKRLNEYGENRLSEKKKTNIILRFLAQFKDFMVITLIIAAVISFFTAYIEGEGSYIDPIIILAIVILNAVIGVVQESKAEHAIDRLRQMSAPEATVVRDSQVQKIPAAQVVVGDILLLGTGDCVAADARLTESVGFKTNESALTGEALPVEKNSAVLLGDDTPLAERYNTVYATSTVLSGHAKAVVTHTGMDTQIGRIADMIGSEKSPLTPLQLKLEKIGRALGLGAVAICAMIFILGVLRRDGLLSSFMLSVSLAVAAIPEGLPAVVTGELLLLCFCVYS